jgi:hypothetical protein
MQRSSPVRPCIPRSASSPVHVCASGSDWEPVDWDSSLSREVVPTMMRKTDGYSKQSSASAVAAVGHRSRLSPLKLI